MKVAVTGGRGFIGSHLVEFLKKRGHLVTCVDLPEGDICAYSILLPFFHEAEWVFHLASLADVPRSFIEWESYYETNVLGTLNVLEASRASGVKKVIYAASASCYGSHPEMPTQESSKISCEHPYAITKWLGEKMVLNYAGRGLFEALSLRLFNVYGPGQKNGVIPTFVAQKKKEIPFTVSGDGLQTRDFVHVQDVCEAFHKAALSPYTQEIFNVGSAKAISINQVVQLLQGEKQEMALREKDPVASCADITKIRKWLQWQPLIAFEEGLRNLL